MPRKAGISSNTMDSMIQNDPNSYLIQDRRVQRELSKHLSKISTFWQEVETQTRVKIRISGAKLFESFTRTTPTSVSQLLFPFSFHHFETKMSFFLFFFLISKFVSWLNYTFTLWQHLRYILGFGQKKLNF
jgi:hypothetical protein